MACLRIILRKAGCDCRFESNCPLVEPGTTGGMPSVGVFLRDPNLYLCEFRRKPRKTPNDWVNKRSRDIMEYNEYYIVAFCIIQLKMWLILWRTRKIKFWDAIYFILQHVPFQKSFITWRFFFNFLLKFTIPLNFVRVHACLPKRL